jgi:hypothetical protein
MKLEKIMWVDFTDSELVDICFDYGIEQECEIDFENKLLKNRNNVEIVLTKFEQELAFG